MKTRETQTAKILCVQSRNSICNEWFGLVNSVWVVASKSATLSIEYSMQTQLGEARKVNTFYTAIVRINIALEYVVRDIFIHNFCSSPSTHRSSSARRHHMPFILFCTSQFDCFDGVPRAVLDVCCFVCVC